jgi:DNA polymerase-3 subunit delta'
MAWAKLAFGSQAVALFQRSVERGRLGHAYLVSGGQLEELESFGQNLAKTLNCEQPPRRSRDGIPLDCCDTCGSCRRIEEENHPDVLWVRPESKLRVIRIQQLVRREGSPPRVLADNVYLKPFHSPFKVSLIVAADRMHTSAANAFLKTLEEPPPHCVLILLSAEPERLLDTIVSRCLRLDLGGDPGRPPEAHLDWVREFAELAAKKDAGLLARYRLLGNLVARLGAMREAIDEALRAEWLLKIEHFPDMEPELRKQLEKELSAAIESEYRGQRADLLGGLYWWLRDVWLHAAGVGAGRETLPELVSFTREVAGRISAKEAGENLRTLENTQRLLFTNVQEALTLEVGLLKLKL